MITVSSTTAFMLYLALTLMTILGIWATHHFRHRKRTIMLLERELFVCEYCQNVYLEDIAKEITQCPECRLFNKSNRYKKKN